MRVSFATMDLPKKAAKRVQKHYTNPESKYPLSKSQALTAEMLGYSSWHELEQYTASETKDISLVDEDCSPEVQRKRIAFQASVLKTYSPLVPELLKSIALSVRVSAANPRSSKLSTDAHRNNRVESIDMGDGTNAWRFMESIRSKKNRDELYELIDTCNSHDFDVESFESEMRSFIEECPEDIVPYHYLLSVADDRNEWSKYGPECKILEQLILNSLPEEYPLDTDTNIFSWGIMSNRDFIRSINYIATWYYANRMFIDAKKWFLFLSRCTESSISDSLGVNDSLEDLSLDTPVGYSGS